MLSKTAWAITKSVALAASVLMPTSVMVPADAKDERPHMDLAFCIDTTGSMQKEIDMVKTKTKELVAKLSTGKPAPIVRVGLVAYRDRGDEYVTKVFPFSDDIDKVVKDISSLQAQGGGDGPESVNEGLHVALNDLSWSESKNCAKLLFLIGDAAPHYYVNDYKWEDESKKAIARGIQINTIACSGLESYPEKDGTAVFKEIAKLTDGKYDTLAYRQEVVNASGRKETIVTSAGATYKVKAGSSDWKSAAVAGMLVKTDSPRTASMNSMGRARLMAAPMSAGAGGGGYAYDSGSASRADSNLDEIVLEAARAKAKKQLKVEY